MKDTTRLILLPLGLSVISTEIYYQHLNYVIGCGWFIANCCRHSVGLSSVLCAALVFIIL